MCTAAKKLICWKPRIHLAADCASLSQWPSADFTSQNNNETNPSILTHSLQISGRGTVEAVFARLLLLLWYQARAYLKRHYTAGCYKSTVQN